MEVVHSPEKTMVLEFLMEDVVVMVDQYSFLQPLDWTVYMSCVELISEVTMEKVENIQNKMDLQEKMCTLMFL